MTDALPGFSFDQKTNELSRGEDVMIALCPRHARLMTTLIAKPDEYVATDAICDAMDMASYEIAIEVHRLRGRLKRLGLSIEAKRRGGYRLVVGDIPKWSPTIPPVTDDPALMKMPLIHESGEDAERPVRSIDR